MKKNFIKYIAALAVAPMLLSSCSDDFLNEIDLTSDSDHFLDIRR